jgi:arylsulfatase A-like enzyme
VICFVASLVGKVSWSLIMSYLRMLPLWSCCNSWGRGLFVLLVIFVQMLVPAGQATSAVAATKQPNIVFFLIDDQRNDTLGCAGHPIVKTPVVDRLAKEGVRFENAFVTTSICAASRASFLTGLVERTHRFTFGTPPIKLDFIKQSYPAVLRENGYRTGFIGKYGVGTEKGGRELMFDSFKSINRGPYFKKQKDGSKRHTTQLAADSAIDFIKANPENKPFCLSISFNASHAEDGDKRPGIGHFPWPKVVDGMYEDVAIPAPRLGDPKIFASQPKYLREGMNRDRFYWRWDEPSKYATNIRAYFRMLSGIDHAIGRVREILEKQGVSDNTVIIYMGDNGYYMGDRGFAGKWSHYEQSLRVPLIIYDPRLAKTHRGKVAKQTALNIDVTATMVALAGIDQPTQYQGESLLGIMSGDKPKTWRTDFFCEHLMNNRSIPKWEGVRSNQWKYARYFEQTEDAELLHDLRNDPDELKNLAKDAKYKDVLAKMRKRCDELRDGYGGPYRPNPRKR